MDEKNKDEKRTERTFRRYKDFFVEKGHPGTLDPEGQFLIEKGMEGWVIVPDKSQCNTDNALKAINYHLAWN